MIHSVGIVYDEMTDDVETQVIRDLLILRGNWPDIWVNDPEGKVDPGLLQQIDVHKTDDKPVLVIVYKTGDQDPDWRAVWPDLNPGIQIVERDLKPDNVGATLDPNPHVGYYLKPQGYDGRNLTELYLTRSHPRGNGVTDPLVVLLWG